MMEKRMAELEGMAWEDYEALIRVAKAAEKVVELEGTAYDQRKVVIALAETLKDVEHLT